MAISKIILNGVTQMDVTQDTVASTNLLSGYTATKNDGTKVSGAYVPPSAPTLQTKSVSYTPTETAQSGTVTPDSGYDGLDEVNVSVGAISSTYVGSGITRRSSSDLTNSLPSGVYRFIVPAGYYAEQAIKDIAKYDLPTPTISIDNSTGVITATSFLGNAGYINTGTKTATEQLTLRDSDDLTVSGATVTVPSGYYSTQASKSVNSGSLNYSGWTETETETSLIMTMTKNFTAGYLSSAPNVSRTFTNVIDTTITPSTSQQTVNRPNGNTFIKQVVVEAMPSGTAGTPTATKGTVSNHSVSVTPSVTNTTGYITGGTKTGTAVSVSASELVSGSETKTSNGTYDVTNLAELVVNVQSSSPTIQSLSITPSTSEQTFNASSVDGYKPVTVAAMPTITLPTAVSTTSSGTSKATLSLTGGTKYLNIPTGYNETAQYYTLNVASGSATGPSSLSGSSATVTTGTNTITLTKTNVTTTPTVSAGYVSSATASTATVALTASVTTKAAATITPGTTNQTIAAGTYLTGTQTIAGDADLIGSNIISTANIFGTQGTVVIQKYYTGANAPSSSLGNNGDIYLQE